MNKNIKVIPFPAINNAYIVISGNQSQDTGNGCRSNMSFFYGTDNGGCEWEPNHGAITVITPCSKTDEHSQQHWFYDYCTGYGNWSQCSVDVEQLPQKFLDGDYVALFAVLKDWSNHNVIVK